jgi:hypothetical protein
MKHWTHVNRSLIIVFATPRTSRSARRPKCSIAPMRSVDQPSRAAPNGPIAVLAGVNVNCRQTRPHGRQERTWVGTYLGRRLQRELRIDGAASSGRRIDDHKRGDRLGRSVLVSRPVGNRSSCSRLVGERFVGPASRRSLTSAQNGTKTPSCSRSPSTSIDGRGYASCRRRGSRRITFARCAWSERVTSSASMASARLGGRLLGSLPSCMIELRRSTQRR